MKVVTSEDLVRIVNAALRKQSALPRCQSRHMGNAEVSIQVARPDDAGTGRVELRIAHIGGVLAADMVLVVMDEHGRLVDTTCASDTKNFGKTTYRAYNIPASVKVQVRLMNPAQFTLVVAVE